MAATTVSPPIVNKTIPFDDSGKVLAGLDKPKVSKPIMTKFELNQVLGLRTMQLSLGSTPFIPVENINVKSNMELRKIALDELKAGALPLIIKRPLPNNKYEFVRIRDLDLTAVKHMLR